MAIGSARRVRCKLSPNRANAPAPAPKKRKTILIDQEQVKKEGLRNWEEPEDEFKGFWITSIHHDITGTYFSSEGENFYRPDSPYLPDSRLDYGTNGTHFSTDGEDSHLPDSCIQYKTAEASSDDEGEDFSVPDSPYFPDSRLALFHGEDSHFSLEGGDSYLPDLCPQYKTSEGISENEKTSNAESMVDMWACGVCKAATFSTSPFPCCHICPCWDCKLEVNNCPICGVARTDGRVFTAEDGDSHPPDSPQYNINGTRYPAQGVDSYRLASHLQHKTAEGTADATENEDASEAKSQADKWACHVCKAAVVSIVVLPCRHLCLCWGCEPETDCCPICGEAKTDIFYIRNT